MLEEANRMAASAGDVLDVELFAKFLRQFLRHQPCDDVGDASGREGTMILTGLLGYCWAKAEPGITSATASATMRMNLLISGLSLVAFSPPVVVLAIGGRAAKSGSGWPVGCKPERRTDRRSVDAARSSRWHEADVSTRPPFVRFRTKADMPRICRGRVRRD